MNLQSCEHPFASNRVHGSADFRPDWDVRSVGQATSAALTRDIELVRKHPQPDPTRRIHLILGSAGYGKTHLFGRVHSDQTEGVQFVFVPAIPSATRPAEYMCWQLVETLFHSAGQPFSPLRRLMARFLRPSFAAYFDQLAEGLRAKTAEIRQALANDPLAVFDVIGSVTDLSPFQALADSVRQRHPDLPASTVRALILGLSPASDEARTWLRGEADQIPSERLTSLRLDERSPEPVDVFRVVGTFLARIGVPLVLYLDQLDAQYVAGFAGFQELATHLMAWLQAVPDLVIVLGCLDANWQQICEHASLSAFVHRVRAYRLEPLNPAQARELVCRRVQSWDEYDPTRGDGWPFDLASVEKFVLKQPVSPRGFIDCCARAFNEWLGKGKKNLIALEPGTPSPTQLPELFLQEWNQQLANTRSSLKAATDYQDAELWAGVVEALHVARIGQHTPQGVRFEEWQPQALIRSEKDPRHSAELRLSVGEIRIPVVLAVSKKDGGTPFSHWMAALEKALGGSVAGAVVIWPKNPLAIGKTADSYRRYRALVDKGTIREFYLDTNADSFSQIECLRRLIQDASAGMVLLDGKTLSVDECRKMMAQTRVLANLKLFEFLFEGWPASKLELTVAATRAAPDSKTSQPAAESRASTSAPAVVAPVISPKIAPTAPAPKSPEGASWAERMLDCVVEKLRGRGQPVRRMEPEVGPTFVRLKVVPEGDTDFAKVKRQADNLKMHLGVDHRPIIAAQAGFISIDVQRPDRQTVQLSPLLAKRPADFVGQPAFPVGEDVGGRAHWLNLAEPATCHLLVAGTTGSGKSQLLKSMIAALAEHLGPDQVQFLLIDPKRVTFNLSGQSPYLRRPVVFDAAEALPIVEECCQEMDRRYVQLQDRGKEHIGELTGKDSLPRWVLVFDEFADLMTDKASKKQLESYLTRLGAKARAAGIHLVLGTQRPEASVVTPLLRSNLPGRIGLQVPTERDSKIILDEPDAAHLLDKGDLFWRRGGALVRLQSPFVRKEELDAYLRIH
jgi:energy-coupling factor transporter ATP-binding protein EcfA2